MREKTATMHWKSPLSGLAIFKLGGRTDLQDFVLDSSALAWPTHTHGDTEMVYDPEFHLHVVWY